MRDLRNILRESVQKCAIYCGNYCNIKGNGETDFLVCEGLRPLRAVNVTFEAAEGSTTRREARGLITAIEDRGVPAELVSIYPVKGLPEGIENRLAHRYLAAIR